MELIKNNRIYLILFFSSFSYQESYGQLYGENTDKQFVFGICADIAARTLDEFETVFYGQRPTGQMPRLGMNYSLFIGQRYLLKDEGFIIFDAGEYGIRFDYFKTFSIGTDSSNESSDIFFLGPTLGYRMSDQRKPKTSIYSGGAIGVVNLKSSLVINSREYFMSGYGFGLKLVVGKQFDISHFFYFKMQVEGTIGHINKFDMELPPGITLLRNEENAGHLAAGVLVGF